MKKDVKKVRDKRERSRRGGGRGVREDKTFDSKKKLKEIGEKVGAC